MESVTASTDPLIPRKPARKAQSVSGPPGAGARADPLAALGFDAERTREYRACGCNLFTFARVLFLWLLVSVCASFALVIVQYAAGLYVPSFVPGASYPLAFGGGLYFLGFITNSFGTVHLGGAFVFAGMFLQGFELRFAGPPPFSRAFTAGVVQWDGRVLVRNTPDVEASSNVLTLFWFVWLTNIILAFGLCLLSLTLLVAVQCYNGKRASPSRPIFTYNYVAEEDADAMQIATFLTWRSTHPMMLVKYARGFSGFCVFVGVFIQFWFAVSEISARNAGGGTPRTYAWTRSPSPQFALVFAGAMCWTDLVPQFVDVSDLSPSDRGELVKRASSREITARSVLARTRNMGGRADWYAVLLFLLWFGSASSLAFVSGDYGVRLLGNTDAYRAQVAAAGQVPDFSNCFASTQCYAYINPVFDGDATYVLNKTTSTNPQPFASLTWNQNFIELWIALSGLACAVTLSIEFVAAKCTSWTRTGFGAATVVRRRRDVPITVDAPRVWTRVPPSSFERFCSRRWFDGGRGGGG